MPLSLADRILSYPDTSGPRGAARRTLQQPGCAESGLGKALLRSAVEGVIGAGGVRVAVEHEGGGRCGGEGGAGTMLRGIEEVR